LQNLIQLTDLEEDYKKTKKEKTLIISI
jgi:hypothetical protein